MNMMKGAPMATILIVDEHMLKMVHAAHPDRLFADILMQPYGWLRVRQPTARGSQRE